MLLLCFLASFVVSIVLVASVWPSRLDESSEQLSTAITLLLWYSTLLALIMRPISKSGASLRLLVGRRPDATAVGWAMLTGLALFGVSFGFLYAVYFPLSYVAPDLVQWWVIEAPIVISTGADRDVPANVINLVLVSVIAPFVEEVFFRGLLLPAWVLRFGRRWAVILVSMLFAVLHVEILGGFLFGAVTAMTYLNTGALSLPIIIHITNNMLAIGATLAALLIFGPVELSLADFRASWLLGVIGFVGGAPLLVAVLRRMPSRRSATESTVVVGTI